MVRQCPFFTADLGYQSPFAFGQGLKPHIRLEVSFYALALNPIDSHIRSLIAQAQKKLPEVQNFPCIDPIKTATDKLSALAWHVRKRGAPGDDSTIIRHLHDLAALVRQIAVSDTGRGREPAERFKVMLDCLHNDKTWANEYAASCFMSRSRGMKRRSSSPRPSRSRKGW